MSEVRAGQVLRFQWNNYTTSWGPAIRDLRVSGMFHDLTLVTSDNQLVTAHKMVLAACSAFFKGLLSSLPLQTTGPLHPAVLYMRGVTGPTLLKLLDFMYNGEVNVEHAFLKEFLQVGEDLRIEGLCEKNVAGKLTNDTVVVPPVPIKKEEKENKLQINNKPPPAPVSKQKEKAVRKKERAEKQKRKTNNNINGKENSPAPASVSARATKRKEITHAAPAPIIEKVVNEEVVAVVTESETSTPVNNTIVNSNNKYDVYELGDSSEENENFSLRGDKDSRTPRKKAKRSMEEAKDEAINRDVIHMDLGEAHGILKLVENLETIEENSEDLNVFVSLLNQLILKSEVGGNILFFCGICQKSLKSKSHMLTHIESSHVKGVEHKCSDCGVKFKTRGGLSTHKVKVHKHLKKEDSKADSEDKIDGDRTENEFNTSFMEASSQSFELSNNISGSEDSGAENE